MIVVKYNQQQFKIDSKNETCAMLKAHISQLIHKPVEAIRLIHNGYAISQETIITDQSIICCLIVNI